jgi:hypothetical protein
MELHGRRAAIAITLLNEAQNQVRLEQPSIEHWACVVWTDDNSLSTKNFGSVYVTRRTEEKYNQSCCAPKSGLLLFLDDTW